MGYLRKIFKYLVCVGITMVGFMLFVLIFGGIQELSEANVEVLLPISLGVGWILYQFWVNKIHEKGLCYYWMIAKVTIQMFIITLISLFIMMSVVK